MNTRRSKSFLKSLPAEYRRELAEAIEAGVASLVTYETTGREQVILADGQRNRV